ncbi:MAG: sulfotransferase [Bacteroidota bacterium]
MSAPTFVIGYPRSGTTLLADLLGRHSQVAVPPETRFAAAIHEHYQPAGLPQPSTPAEFVEGVLHTYPRLRDVDVDWSRVTQRIEHARNGEADHGAAGRGAYEADPPQLLRAVLEEYAEQQGKPYVIEKSPVHLLYAATLVDWFPACRFVWIIRDGRDAVLSMLGMPWAHDVLALHAAEWTYRMDMGAKLLHTHPDRVHIIRYEDVLTTPVQTFRALCTYLDISFEPRMLDPEQGGSTVPAWEQAWKGKVTGQLDPSRIGGWQRKATLAQQRVLHAIMGPALERWGYDVPSQSRLTVALGAPLRMPAFRYVRGAMEHTKGLLRKSGIGVPLSRAHVIEEAFHSQAEASSTVEPRTPSP